MGKKVIVNFEDYVGEYSTYPYHNGGWVKAVIDIDKSKSDGYCFVGDFVNRSGLVEVESGLYIVCDIQGSRSDPEKSYMVVEVTDDGKIEEMTDWVYGRDWALKFRDKVSEILERDRTKAFNAKEYWDSLCLKEIDKKVLVEYIKSL